MSVPRAGLITSLMTGAVAVGLLGLAGCTSSPQGSGPESSSTPTSSVIAPNEPATAPGQTATVPGQSGGQSDGQVIINISLLNGKVQPNGQKIDVKRGQEVLLNVVSDHADEVHVHGDYDIELAVPVNTPVSRSFVADKLGSVEVESHEPEKIIAILNIR